ncbi:MAG TPA: Spy/CpxP family protein refolding chaperone [Acetobacteraceae bacterium]|nr:Spy/CpxP family protein refolding chaperone [Acetobacteraceae bacterium]
MPGILIASLSGFTLLSASAQAAGTAAPAANPPAATAPKTAAPNPAAMVEQRIADLHTKLKITPAESTLWNNFATVMRGNAKHMDGLFQQRMTMAGKMTALQNMQSYAQLAQAHADGMAKLLAAFTPLYNAMPAAQKSMTDQVFDSYAARHAAAHTQKGQAK